MDCIELLRELIRIDTTNPPGGELAAAEYLAGVLKPYGFSCEIQKVAKNRANLIAVLGEGDGPELMLNGHLDVVPAAGAWSMEPFQLTEEGDHLYGRGTADMKGGIAAMCEAAIRTAKKQGPRRGRLKLLFVADEECSNLGTLSYLKTHKASQYAIIGEPTNLHVAVAHRGASRNYIDIYGKARHAALPTTETDSIAGLAKSILAVEDMNRGLKAITHEVLPPPGISITMVQGYEKDNVVPGTIRLLLDFRILPGMSQEDVEAVLDAGFCKAGLENYRKTLHFYMPGGEVQMNDSLVQLCVRERDLLFGEKTEPCAFDASCEQCFLVEHGTRTVICGPGNIGQAHTVNEYTSEKQVRQAVDFYERMIERILV